MADADDVAACRRRGASRRRRSRPSISCAVRATMKSAVAVLLELRALMGVLGVLDGEVVQLELALHPQQQLAARLQQADPRRRGRRGRPRRRRRRSGMSRSAPAVAVDAGGDDARFEVGGFRRRWLSSILRSPPGARRARLARRPCRREGSSHRPPRPQEPGDQQRPARPPPAQPATRCAPTAQIVSRAALPVHPIFAFPCAGPHC